MIRYMVILILLVYSFQLKLDSIHRDSTFKSLYDTCGKTTSMITDINYRLNSRKDNKGKLLLCQKNNNKLLYNYRECVASLGSEQDKSDKLLFANNLFND